jgi:DNA-binding transcriptional ArsR family regulator
LPDKTRRMNPEARIVTSVKCAFERQGYLVSTERALGYGRADLVAYQIDPAKCEARRLNGQFRSLERVEQYTVLRHLPEIGQGDEITTSELCDRLGRSKTFVSSQLVSFLERAGYVERIGNKLARRNGFIPIAKEIVAIEAKVSDWKKGAIQAKRYRWFADKVYLAIAAKYCHRVQVELLQKHKIGLLSVDCDRVSELLASPSLTPCDADRHSFAAEWLWRYRRKAVMEAVGIASDI